jgi:hypothetical protein
MAITERRRYRIERKGVRSLVWVDGELLDHAATMAGWGLPFDGAVVSPTGAFAAAITRLGTKGVILKHGKVLREINRSYYCAQAYLYPIAFARLEDGREVLIHCPDAYNKLEVELAETGERLTSRPGKGIDVFHSRLSASPSGRHLVSAGWLWHPFGIVQVFDLQAALARPETLDEPNLPLGRSIAGEVQSACWIDADRLLVATDPDAERLDAPDFEPASLGQGELACWSISKGEFTYRTQVGRSVGPTMAVGDDTVITFFEHPTLTNTRTGAVELAWQDIDSGREDSSIVWHRPPDPPIALDPARARFAVADADGITVVEVG